MTVGGDDNAAGFVVILHIHHSALQCQLANCKYPYPVAIPVQLQPKVWLFPVAVQLSCSLFQLLQLNFQTLSLIDCAHITSKIGHFTLDNASNNVAAMKELENLLATKCDVAFNHLNNRIMCYPHIINVCTTHIVATSTQVSRKYLDSNSLDGDDDDDFDPIYSRPHTGPELDEEFIALQLPERQAWLRSLKSNPVKHVADIVCYICALDARKQTFTGIVRLCTKDDPELCQAKPLELIQHVKTRWDSVYLMLEHFHFLRKAVDMYFANDSAIKSMKLSTTDWELLEGIEVVLEEHPELWYWTQIGLVWARKYYKQMDDTDAYVISLVLNPSMRFLWIQREWDSEYIERSKRIMLNLASI
ncbi:hypothetical protein EDB83DRAFT_2321967 [Lactarius deliciosus]|nr:hypothetical protein EDB83DRAFT_2321967 [Lactarius deliciosus]